MAMTMGKLDRVKIAVHDTSAPTEEEWARWVGLCAEPGDRLRFLVESHGGAPNAKQRKALNDVLAGREVRSAVLTDSIVARGVVTALAWLGIPLRAFPLGDYKSAGEYLGLSHHELTVVVEQLRILRKECGVNEVRAAS
ncbi:MAG TPA: hypothetical protein VJV78_48555 [Polyangiales bacterium]|nr:hypothetical protein [Polyangiales bacterium]